MGEISFWLEIRETAEEKERTFKEMLEQSEKKSVQQRFKEAAEEKGRKGNSEETRVKRIDTSVKNRSVNSL